MVDQKIVVDNFVNQRNREKEVFFFLQKIKVIFQIHKELNVEKKIYFEKIMKKKWMMNVFLFFWF